MTLMIWNDYNLNFIINYQPNNQQTLDIFVLILFKNKNLKNKWLANFLKKGQEVKVYNDFPMDFILMFYVWGSRILSQ